MADRSAWVVIPPPPLFVAAFVAGVGVSRLVPAALVPASVYPTARWVGIALIVVALTTLSAPLLFLRHRTTIVPAGSARTLITAGPYRFTRNPMYLGLAIAYVGAALIVNAVWPLVFVIMPIAVLQLRVIPFEEARLVAIFGDEYRDYQQRVRRWI